MTHWAHTSKEIRKGHFKHEDVPCNCSKGQDHTDPPQRLPRKA